MQSWLTLTEHEWRCGAPHPTKCGLVMLCKDLVAVADTEDNDDEEEEEGVLELTEAPHLHQGGGEPVDLRCSRGGDGLAALFACKSGSGSSHVWDLSTEATVWRLPPGYDWFKFGMAGPVAAAGISSAPPAVVVGDVLTLLPEPPCGVAVLPDATVLVAYKRRLVTLSGGRAASLQLAAAETVVDIAVYEGALAVLSAAGTLLHIRLWEPEDAKALLFGDAPSSAPPPPPNAMFPVVSSGCYVTASGNPTIHFRKDGSLWVFARQGSLWCKASADSMYSFTPS